MADLRLDEPLQMTWHRQKSTAAKNGLEREMADWLRDTGLVQREGVE